MVHVRPYEAGELTSGHPAIFNKMGRRAGKMRAALRILERRVLFDSKHEPGQAVTDLI